MDVQKYIDSGILEAYCMGVLDDEEQAFLIQMSMLYPEVKDALTAAELIMEELAMINAKIPNPNIKGKMMASLGFGDQLDINNLPAIGKDTDSTPWLNVVEHLIPAEPYEEFSVTDLTTTNNLRQFLVVTKSDVAEEEHGDFFESFLILKGQCVCTIGDKLIELKTGDFLEIPLHAKHAVKVTSSFVVAILQYQFI